MGVVFDRWRMAAYNFNKPKLKEETMGINRATAEFDIKIRQQINDSGLPPCVIRLELINILREVEDLEKAAIQKEQGAEDESRNSGE